MRHPTFSTSFATSILVTFISVLIVKQDGRDHSRGGLSTAWHAGAGVQTFVALGSGSSGGSGSGGDSTGCTRGDSGTSPAAVKFFCCPRAS